MSSRPEIPHLLVTLIDAAFERAHSELKSNVAGYPERLAAVGQLNAIAHSALHGDGAIPYLADLGPTFTDGPLEDVRMVIQLLEAVQALTEWQIDQPTGINADAVCKLFALVGPAAPWKAPAEVVFRDGNVSPGAQRLIRAMKMFKSDSLGGAMMTITVVEGSGALITALGDSAPLTPGSGRRRSSSIRNGRSGMSFGADTDTAHVTTLSPPLTSGAHATARLLCWGRAVDCFIDPYKMRS